MKEGGVAAGMQIVDDIGSAESKSQSVWFHVSCDKSLACYPAVTISSDGTPHRHIQFDARHHVLNNRDTHMQRTPGVTSAHDHKSEAQAQQWKERVKEFFDWYNASPREVQDPLDWRIFVKKLAGMLTDHAEDQKKLFRLILAWKRTVDREVHGAEAMKAVSLPDSLLAMAEEDNAAVARKEGRLCGPRFFIKGTRSPAGQYSHPCGTTIRRGCVRGIARGGASG